MIFIQTNEENEVIYEHHLWDEVPENEKSQMGEGFLVASMPTQPTLSKVYRKKYTPQEGFTFVLMEDTVSELEQLKLMVADLALNAGGVL